jgi:D-alanyl-D-alanine dipeptidase
VIAVCAEATCGGDKSRTKRFHPNIARVRLVPLDYISAVSGHSRGDSVDLTLVTIPVTNASRSDNSQSYGDCTAPLAKRGPDESVDMGTSFDCFDTKSHTFSTAITSEQRNWRQTLLRAITDHGFRNYSREWWHFTFGSGNGQSYEYSHTVQPPR